MSVAGWTSISSARFILVIGAAGPDSSARKRLPAALRDSRIVTSAPLNRSGAASGMLGTARLTGQTIGAVLLAVIFSIAGAHDARGPVIALFLAAAFAAVSSAFSMSRLGAPRVS